MCKVWAIALVTQVSHQGAQQPGCMFHIRQTFIPVKAFPVVVLPAAHSGIGRQIFLPGVPGFQEGCLVFSMQPIQNGLSRQHRAGIAATVNFHLQQHTVGQQRGRCWFRLTIALHGLPA